MYGAENVGNPWASRARSFCPAAFRQLKRPGGRRGHHYCPTWTPSGDLPAVQKVHLCPASHVCKHLQATGGPKMYVSVFALVVDRIQISRTSSTASRTPCALPSTLFAALVWSSMS